MGKRRKGSNKKRSNNKKQQQQQQQFLLDELNFVSEAGPGCHIVRQWAQNKNIPRRIQDYPSACPIVLGWEQGNELNENYDLDDDETRMMIPDVALDPNEQTLTLCNVDSTQTKVAFISILGNETICLDKFSKPLEKGITTILPPPTKTINSDQEKNEKQPNDQEAMNKDDNAIVNQKNTTQNYDYPTSPCTTFIVLCPPRTFCHLCRLDCKKNNNHPNNDSLLSRVIMDTDVQPWNRHPDPNGMHDFILPQFPLETTLTTKQFLCTQGVGGQLTHFMRGNYHAMDFQCPVGTPLVAVAKCRVVESNISHECCSSMDQDEQQQESGSTTYRVPCGIGSRNLYQWNHLLLQVLMNEDDDVHSSSDRKTTNNKKKEKQQLFVEYVHIATSCVVPGQIVEQGERIGTSGNVGFCPEPHLHFSAYESAASDAPTIGIRFATIQQQQQDDADSSSFYIPRAGMYYPI